VKDTGNTSADILLALADGDLSGIDARAHNASRSRNAASPDAELAQVAEIAALAAMDASPASWFVYLGADQHEIPVDRVVATLVAVAPIVGAPRLVSAAANIISASELADDLDDDAS